MSFMTLILYKKLLQDSRAIVATEFWEEKDWESAVWIISKEMLTYANQAFVNKELY